MMEHFHELDARQRLSTAVRTATAMALLHCPIIPVNTILTHEGAPTEQAATDILITTNIQAHERMEALAETSTALVELMDSYGGDGNAKLDIYSNWLSKDKIEAARHAADKTSDPDDRQATTQALDTIEAFSDFAFMTDLDAQRQIDSTSDPVKKQFLTRALLARRIANTLPNPVGRTRLTSNKEQRAQTDLIEDTTLRGAARRSIDAKYAMSYSEGLGSERAYVAENSLRLAEWVEQQLEDPEILQAFQRVVDAYKHTGQDSPDFTTARADLEALTQGIRKPLNAYLSQVTAPLSKSWRRIETVQRDSEAESKTLNDTLPSQYTTLIQRGAKKLQPNPDDVYSLNRPVANHTKTLNFQRVKATKPVRSLGLDPACTVGSKDQAIVGDIHPDNDTLRFSSYADNELDTDTFNQMAAALEPLAPLIKAAMANGDMAAVRFFDVSYLQGCYFGLTREAQIGLKNGTTVEQLRLMVTHETVHALTRTAFDEHSPVSPDELHTMQDTCQSLQTIASRQMSLSAKQLAEDVRILGPEASPLAPATKELSRILTDPNQLLKLMTEAAKSEPDIALDLAACSPPNIYDMLRIIGQRQDIKDLDYYLEYLRKSDAYKKAQDNVRSALIYAPFFSQLNEFHYAQRSQENDELIGHDADNASELVASVTNVAINYPDAFIATLRHMNLEERQAAISSLRVSLDAITNRHKSLVPYFTDLEDYILTGVNN